MGAVQGVLYLRAQIQIFSIFFTSFFRFGIIRYGGPPQKFLSGSEFCKYQPGVPRTLLNGVHKIFEVLSAFIVRLG